MYIVGKLCFEGDAGLPFFDHPLLFGNGVGLHKARDDIVPLDAENKVPIEGDFR